MADVKFGLDQANKPAPPLIRNALRASTFFCGASGLFFNSLRPEVLSDAHKLDMVAAASFFLICLQAIEILLGIQPTSEKQNNDQPTTN